MKTAILLLATYLYFKPSLDKTHNGDTLLWFWNIKREERKYIKLW